MWCASLSTLTVFFFSHTACLSFCEKRARFHAPFLSILLLPVFMDAKPVCFSLYVRERQVDGETAKGFLRNAWLPCEGTKRREAGEQNSIVILRSFSSRVSRLPFCLIFLFFLLLVFLFFVFLNHRIPLILPIIHLLSFSPIAFPPSQEQKHASRLGCEKVLPGKVYSHSRHFAFLPVSLWTLFCFSSALTEGSSSLPPVMCMCAWKFSMMNSWWIMKNEASTERKSIHSRQELTRISSFRGRSVACMCIPDTRYPAAGVEKKQDAVKK